MVGNWCLRDALATIGCVAIFAAAPAATGGHQTRSHDGLAAPGAEAGRVSATGAPRAVYWQPFGLTHTKALPPRTAVLRQGSSVEWLAADGASAVFGHSLSSGNRGRCAHASLWDVSTGRLVRFPLTRASICDYDWPFFHVQQTAMAGDRIAWVGVGGNNSFTEFKLFTARAGGQPRVVARGEWTNEGPSPGDRIGLLAGDQEDIVFHTWTIGKRGVTSNEQLWRIGVDGKTTLLAAAPGTRAVAVHGGRVAVLTSGGTVRLLDQQGRLVKTVRLRGAPTRWRKRKDFDLGFDGTHLAVLADDALDVYDIRTSRRLHTWPLPPSNPDARGLVDVHSGVVTYLDRTSIELRRVIDGKRASFRPGSELRGCDDPDVWAQIEQTGLFYSLSAAQCTYDGTFRLRFIPLREVLGKLR